MPNQIDRDVYVTRDVLKTPIQYVRGTDYLPIVMHFRDFNIPEDASAQVFIAKPSGNIFYGAATISGNDVTIATEEQMFIELGLTLMQISIQDNNKELISFAQPVYVSQNLKSGDLPDSTTDIKFLDQAIQEANEAVDTATTAAQQAAIAVQNANQAIQNANGLISELNEQVSSLNTNYASLVNGVSIPQLNTTSKTVVGALNELNGKSIGNNAGGHNSIFRGKNLGTSFTSAMSTAIQNGSFDDLYVGDYLTINGTVYRVAGFNLIKNCGDNVSIGNNMCLVPDSALYNAQMHNTDSGEYESGSVANDTTGAYANSDMRTTNLTQATNKIITDFGSSHVISYKDMLPNATADGQASGFAWYDCKVELMSEVMVYGTKVWGNIGYEVGCLNEQFPLFRLNPESIHHRLLYWLRSVGSATYFACVSIYGTAYYYSASNTLGVRPFFFVN